MATAAERIKGYQKNGGNSRVSQLLSPSLKKQAEDYTRSKRDKIFKTSQEESLKQTQEQVGLQEENRGGFFSSLLNQPRDLIRLATRGKQDEDYLRQIEQNNKTVAEILKAKKTRPEKEGEYNLMLETLLRKNNSLVSGTGGNTKNLSDLQMAGKAIGAVTTMIPTLGGGMTAAGNAIRAVGGKALFGSLLKEGGTLGFIGGVGEVVEKKQTKPAEIFGTLATNTIIGTVANAAIGYPAFSISNKITEKLGNYFAGEKVNFTPKEKDFLEENVPEFSDEELFRQAGLESPIEKTDTDLTAKTIAAADDEATIKSILSGKVSEEDSDFLSKSLKNITDPDEVASILDEYDPAKVKANLAEKISMLDNEKRIGSLLKDTVSESDIPNVSKLLKNMENEDEIVKVLDEFESKKLADDAAKVSEETTVQTPEVKVDEPPVEKTFVERDMTDSELADALMKKERSMFKEDNPRFQANSKAAGMKYSSIKKRLNGDATQKEINNARKYLESGYIGKEVKVGGKKGIIKKMIYGDYGIDFGDGKIKKVSLDDIRGKKVTDKQVIQHIIDGAKKELEGSANIFKSVSRKISEEVLPKPKAEAPKPKPVEKSKEPVKETKKKTPKTEKKTEPEDPLLQEARKYKSAEEFVKAQTNAYHSGSADIQAVNTGKSRFDKTFYLSDKADYAKGFGGKNASLNGMAVDPKAKLADMRKPSPELVAQIEREISGNPTGKTFRIQKPDGTFVEVPEIKGASSNAVHSNKDIIQGIKDGKAYFAELPEVKTALRKLGYDGQITAEVPYAKNIGIWNKDVVKTKSQLTDLYNKAQGGKKATAEPPKAKAEEPKAKEEPKKETPASGEASSLPSSGKNKTSKLSKSTLRKALENNMIRETLDLPTTERTSFKIQDEKAIDLVIKNTDEAIDIALGFKEPPRDILFGRIYGAVEKYAIANKDFDLLAKLTTSKKSAEFATRAGQEVKALDNSVLGNPRAISQEILKLKEEILKKNKINPDKELKNTLQEINKFIDNSSSTEKDLDDLIKSIKC